MALTVIQQRTLTDRVLIDFRKENSILSAMQGWEGSQLVKSMVEGGGAGLAASVYMSHFAQGGTGGLLSDGYQGLTFSQGATMDSDLRPDLSSGEYDRLTDTLVTFNVNNIAVGTSRIDEPEALFHATGSVDALLGVSSAGLRQQIMDQIGTMVTADIVGQGVYESAVSGGAGTSFNLDTSSEANLRGDFSALASAANRLNFPASDRVLLVNSGDVPKIVQYSLFHGSDSVDRSVASVADGVIQRYQGLTIMGSNHMASGSGALVHPSKVGFYMMPPKLKIIDDVDSLGVKLQLWTLWGVKPLGEFQVAALDGDSPDPNVQHEGILKIVVS